MRNVVKILTAGTLAFSLMIGVAYGDGAVTGPQFTLKTSQLAVQPNSTFTVKVGLSDVQDLGALQFKMKLEGIKGAKVDSITIDSADATYPLPNSVPAVDIKGNRAGIASLAGGANVDTAHLATVTISVPNANGMLKVGLDSNKDQTFLRNSGAGAIHLAKATEPLIIRVGEATPTSKKRKSTR